MKARTALSRSSLPGLEYALNPYSGCSHGCVYCYAPDVLRMPIVNDWGSFCEKKEGIPNILAKELKRKEKGMIGLGTVTDPYQRMEADSKLTRYCLEQISLKRWPVCVQTKSDLVTRDIDILSRIEGAEVGITLTTLDREVAKKIEPGAPPPGRRVDALDELVNAGIRTWVFIGPIIPGINDDEDDIIKLMDRISHAGIKDIQYDRLRSKPLLAKRMEDALGVQMASIDEHIKSPEWKRSLDKVMKRACDELDIRCRKAF